MPLATDAPAMRPVARSSDRPGGRDPSRISQESGSEPPDAPNSSEKSLPRGTVLDPAGSSMLSLFPPDGAGRFSGVKKLKCGSTTRSRMTTEAVMAHTMIQIRARFHHGRGG